MISPVSGGNEITTTKKRSQSHHIPLYIGENPLRAPNNGAFDLEILALIGAPRANAAQPARQRARAHRPEPGRDSTPLFFRVARAPPSRGARALLTIDHLGGHDRFGGWTTAPAGG